MFGTRRNPFETFRTRESDPEESNTGISGRFGHGLRIGTFGDDNIEGGEGRDIMLGLRGDDTLDGGNGDDVMLGGFGDDSMSGGNGDDIMLGGFGDDTVIGNRGEDLMRGGFGDDKLVWNNGDGSDRMDGGRGYDTTEVNFFTDLVNNDLQNDDTARIETAGRGVQFARTEVNGQTQFGLFELDIDDVEALEVNFGGGDDTAELVGDVAEEIAISLDGGAEDENGDTLDLSELDSAATVFLDIESAIGRGPVQNGPAQNSLAQIGLGQKGVVLTGGAEVAANDFENVIGTNFDDNIVGNFEENRLDGRDGNDDIFGSFGDDTVFGGNGNDTLDGGEGNDLLVGNRGDDTMLGGFGNDRMVWNNGDGTDLMDGGAGVDTAEVNFFTDLVNNDLQNDDRARIQTAANGVLFARTEVNGQTQFGLFEIDIQDTEALEVNFGGGDDTAELVGDVADQIAIALEGGAEDENGDTLDLSELDSAAVVALDLDGAEGGSPSQNGIVQSGGGTVAANDFENVIGTSFDDTIIGNVEDNRLEGGDGNDFILGDFGDDTMSGGNGDDTLEGGQGNDVLVGNRGDDTMRGGFGNDRMVWNNGDGTDLMDGGAGFDTAEVNFFTDLVNNDLQNDDRARIQTAGNGVLFARTEVNGQTQFGLFEIDIQDTEVLEVNFGGGDDTAELVGDVADQIIMRLEGGAEDENGDTLDLSELAAAAIVQLDVPDEGESSQDGFVQTNDREVIANDFENVIGSDFDDQILGNAEDNRLEGGSGNDTLSGLGGADSIFGGGGDDTIFFEDGAILDGGETDEVGGDVLLVNGTVDFGAVTTTLDNFEVVSTEDGSTDDEITLGLTDILDIISGDTGGDIDLTILGDGDGNAGTSDQVNFSAGDLLGGTGNPQAGADFTTFTFNDGTTVNVDNDVFVNVS